MSIHEQIHQCRIIPVLALGDEKLAAPLAHALCDGGLAVAEVTFRVEGADKVMKEMKRACPEMLIGAGTVLNIEQVKIALDSGAEFIVAPGFNPKVARYCCENNIPYFPGIATPTELEAALEFDLKVLKFFPAEPNGGLTYMKSLAGPYVDIQFMPTGGITPSNLVPYLEFEKTFAVGGTWIAKPDMITSQQFDKIKANVAEAVRLRDGVR